MKIQFIYICFEHPHYGTQPWELILLGKVATDDPADGLATTLAVVLQTAGRRMKHLTSS